MTPALAEGMEEYPSQNCRQGNAARQRFVGHLYDQRTTRTIFPSTSEHGMVTLGRHKTDCHQGLPKQHNRRLIHISRGT
jgi:hypothetical protein